MKPKIIFITTFFLANTFILSNKGSVFAKESLAFPQIISVSQNSSPNRRFVKHRIKIQMPKTTAVSALKIFIPEGVKIGNDITVHTLENEKILANTSVNNGVINVIFPQGYQSGEILKIDLNDVEVRYSQRFLQYRATAQLMAENIDEKIEFPIGVVSIRVRR
jgi:hypothetical protein